MSDQNDVSYKVGLGIWFCFCVLISMWMFTKFMKGKQQLFSNLHVVEDSLLKMQEKMELSQRKKSMGFVETLEDVTAGLVENISTVKQTNEDDTIKDDEVPLLIKAENEITERNKDGSKVKEMILDNKKDV